VGSASRLDNLRRRLVLRLRKRRQQGRHEITGTPTESDREWAEKLIAERGWDELRKKT
jgi:hypothetical protein